MNLMSLVVLLVIVAAIVAGIKAALWHRRRQHYTREAAPHVAWAEKVIAKRGDDKAVVSILRPDYSDYIRGVGRYPDIVYDAVEVQRAAKERIRRQQAMQWALDAYEKAKQKTTVDQRLEAYRWIKLQDLSDDMRRAVERERAEIAEQYVTNLLESARAGFAGQFRALVVFVTLRDGYLLATGRQFVYPSDWDELVAQYYETPCLDDFRGRYTREAPGELRVLANKAVRERSLLHAKVVLAHYDQRGRAGESARKEVGELLMTQLGELVDRMHNELRLTFSE